MCVCVFFSMMLFRGFFKGFVGYDEVNNARSDSQQNKQNI